MLSRIGESLRDRDLCHRLSICGADDTDAARHDQPETPLGDLHHPRQDDRVYAQYSDILPASSIR